jgi:CDGSH-type Zn-finger protein
MAMIEHCPSGALTFRLTVDGPDIEPDLPAGIAVTDDGPYFVTGGIPVERSDGEPFGPRPRMTLCRCGGSANKPLCDGSHKEIGFRDSYAPPS